VLSTDEFKAFAAEVVPFLHVTSRVEGEHHPNLLEEKGGRGFPHVVALDAKGDVVATLQERTVEGFRKMMKGAGDFAALSGKEKRTPAEEMRLVRLLHDMDRIEADEARARANALVEPDEAVKKDRDDFLVMLDVVGELEGKNLREPAARVEVGKTFHDWWKAGREPKDEAAVQPFFILMLDYAEAEKDVALFEKALGKLREAFGSRPETERFFKNQEGRLAKLKEAAPPEPGGGK